MVKTLDNETFDIPADGEVATKVHNMIRYISRRGVDDPLTLERSVWTVDAEVSAWVDRGYRLLATHFLGISEGATPGQAFNSYGVLYILVRD